MNDRGNKISDNPRHFYNVFPPGPDTSCSYFNVYYLFLHRTLLVIQVISLHLCLCFIHGQYGYFRDDFMLALGVGSPFPTNYLSLVQIEWRINPRDGSHFRSKLGGKILYITLPSAQPSGDCKVVYSLLKTLQ